MYKYLSHSDTRCDANTVADERYSWTLLGAVLSLARVKFRMGEQTAKGRALFLKTN